MYDPTSENHFAVHRYKDGRKYFFDFTKPPARVYYVQEVRPLAGYRLWARFDDGLEGVADLSEMITEFPAARQLWVEENRFDEVCVINHGGGVMWDPDRLDMSSNSLYMSITDKPIEEVYPQIQFLD